MSFTVDSVWQRTWPEMASTQALAEAKYGAISTQLPFFNEALRLTRLYRPDVWLTTEAQTTDMPTLVDGTSSIPLDADTGVSEWIYHWVAYCNFRRDSADQQHAAKATFHRQEFVANVPIPGGVGP